MKWRENKERLDHQMSVKGKSEIMGLIKVEQVEPERKFSATKGDLAKKWWLSGLVAGAGAGANMAGGWPWPPTLACITWLLTSRSRKW